MEYLNYKKKIEKATLIKHTYDITYYESRFISQNIGS